MTDEPQAAKLDTEAPRCDCRVVHKDRVERAIARAPRPEELREAGELFKLFADPGRLRILAALAEGELCVCDLSAVLGSGQSAVSHQLALLRTARLVKNRREGKTVYYALDDEHVKEILRVGLEHIAERTASS